MMTTPPPTSRPAGVRHEENPPVDTSGQERPEDTVARLRKTFSTGRTRDLDWRENQLRALSRLLANEEGTIAEALAKDLDRMPGSAWSADIATTSIEVNDAIKNLRKWAKRQRTILSSFTWPSRGFIEPEPLGTVLIIGAWNFPFYLTLGPLVGALAAGNTVIIKPSELASASSRVIADLIGRYLENDAVAVVQGGVEETQALIATGMDHILFTGSPQTGKKIMASAAETLTPVTLELGGKSPAIVTRSADLDVAARRIVWSKLANSGQTCITTDYVIVEDAVKDELALKIVDTVARFIVERPNGQPVIGRRHYERLWGMLQEDHGGTVLAGGRSDEERCLIDFTVVLDPSLEATIMQEEIFGPLLPIVSVGSLNEAIALVASRPKPLAAYLFSSDRSEHEAAVESISSGGLVINHALLHCMTPQLPFGGVGNSGMGVYHGKYGFDTFSHLKPVVRAWTTPDVDLLYPPHTERKGKILRKVLK
jgi:aldehyde dehydrogenase (NAD+)